MIALVDVAEARGLAHRLLSTDLPRRWDHVQGVASQTELFVDRVADWATLASAAYLHDIGYAAEVFDLGFHQVDGARYLRREGWSEAVVNLVAHHSGARIRAEVTGLGEIYAAEFPLDDTLPHQQLHFCDLTVALDGTPTTVRERLADMRYRHSQNEAMLRFLDATEQGMIDMVDSTWELLGRDDGTRRDDPNADQPASAT